VQLRRRQPEPPDNTLRAFYGALLAELRDQQLQGELTTRAAARQWARQRIARNRPAAP